MSTYKIMSVPYIFGNHKIKRIGFGAKKRQSLDIKNPPLT
jgi:hypothetical protein